MNAGDVSGSVALDSVSSVTFTQDTDGTIILHCSQNDEGPMGSDEEPEPIHKRLRLSSEDTEDPASTPSAYSVVALPLSEREESFEVTMTATEMKDDLDQESEDQSKDEKLSSSRKTSDVTAVSQAWFTTKEDKNTLVNKGHKWKQGMWSKEEIDILMSNIENYLKNTSRETSRRHPKQMPEPPQLPPFDVEEQQLYSELLPGDRAPYSISKGAPRHPTEEAHFGRLYPGSYPFGHDPELMTIGLLHGLPELLPDPSFCFRDHHGCSSLGLPVCLSCLRSPPSQPGSIGLLLQLDGIPYFQCPPLCSGIAAAAGTRDLTATAPDGCVNNGGGEHGPLRLNVPNLPRDLVETLPEVGVENPPNRGISKTFSTDPHDTFGPAKSVRHPPPQADPTHHQVDSSAPLFTRVSKTCGRSTEVQQQNTARVQIRGAVPPNPSPPGITIIAHMGVPQYNYGVRSRSTFQHPSQGLQQGRSFSYQRTDEVELLQNREGETGRSSSSTTLQNRGIQDPSEIIFEMSKEERKDFYRSIAWGLNRPLFAVYRRVLRMYDNRNHVGKYTQEEIEKLKELRQKHGNDWATIGSALGRSASSVKDRCRLMKDTCHTGKWTEEEERRLTEVVHELTGTVSGDVVTQGVSWASVADLVGTRSEKQCRSKWLNYLNWKQSGGTEWTKEDDINLIRRCVIIELSVEDENEINWDILAEGWSSVRSPQWLRSKWWTIKRQVANHKDLPFPGNCTNGKVIEKFLLKGLQDVVEAPSSTVNKVVVVGSRSVHASSSPVTALQIPVQIPVQITHVSSSDSTSGSSESGTITLNSGALQTFELLPSFHLQPTGTPGTYFLQTGSNQSLPLTLSTNSTVTLAAAGSPASPEQIILHSLGGDSLSDNVTVQMSHPGIIIQTVTSEDLPDPLNGPECSKEGDESSEQSSKVMQEDSTDKSSKLKDEAVNSGIGDGAVLTVPSPSSFIPTSDITTESVLPVGTLTDLEKAYDRVPREELWYCMRKSGVAEKYVRVVQDMYERSRTVVRCAVGQTEEFNVEVGLHQGSALSPFLFAIVMDQLSEEVRQESPWTMIFADDIVICSESREQVEENLERWRFALERRGMKISRSKTEYMCVNEREGSGTVRLQGEEVKKVQEFKYLGSTVQSNGECGKEVKKRVQAGWNVWRKVSGVLCDQKISARIKGKVYRTVVRPAMLYGLETVSLRKRQESELEVAELKMLRFSLGVTRLDRIRNEYIRETAHVGCLGDKDREARLRWFGHVQRRD
ncbi:hypothetical protein QTP70_018978, partial [Hemibagrus guttatus]